jgi:2-polyprenyl-3-methyl-5-hydroxy-6-metoxy-1,4-benzoquinol methylase
VNELLPESNPDEIRTRPCPECYLCGAPGKTLYQGLRDRLFGAPGEWNLKECPNPECGLIWLDPVPVEEDIGKAYQNYYTHKVYLRKGIKRFVHRMMNGAILRITRIYKEQRRINYMYLEEMKPGKLLEVGCGSGQFLDCMRRAGWEVEGVEIDSRAADYARKKYGVPVHIGTLESMQYPDNTFDAVTMNHVIEHVYEPVTLLQECHRVLKPGGRLVVVTPNTISYGHRRFRQYWRGLEPPRHLYVFSPVTLRRVAERAGFQDVLIWTTLANAYVII